MIPLLCDYDVFDHGMRILRSKQGEGLTPEAVHKRYQPTICWAMKTGVVPYLPPVRPTTRAPCTPRS